jgi:hypothetical protein
VHAVAISLALATIVTLELIVLIGAGVPNSAAGNRPTAILVPIKDLCLETSSALLTWILGRMGARALAGLFLFNLALFAAAAVMRASGSIPPRWLLYAVDVYWPSLYLITLARHWPIVSGRSAM